jgi:PPOX class probable F420-dependent enzyme
MTPEQEQFLRDHKQCVLATSRRDGRPQVSTVGYHYDGTDVIVSTKAFAAKWKNALRQPHVALVINDGRKQLIVYGRAEGVSADPDRLALTRLVPGFRAMLADQSLDDATLRSLLDEGRRTVLRIRPETTYGND